MTVKFVRKFLAAEGIVQVLAVMDFLRERQGLWFRKKNKVGNILKMKM